MTLSTTDEERQAYRDSRRASRYVKGASATFEQWVKYGHALVAARSEAMRAASADQPGGSRYNSEINKILMREGLVDFFHEDRTQDGKTKRRNPFAAASTRKATIALIENLHRPVDSRRRKGILAWWTEELSEDERRRLNHPKAILRCWRKETEPTEERAVHLECEVRKTLALAETALELNDVRAQDLRGLLGRVLDEVEHLHADLREAIERELRT